MSERELEKLQDLLDSGRSLELARLSRTWSLVDGPGAAAFHLAGLACGQLRWLEEAAANFQSAVLLDPWSGRYWADVGEAWYRLRQLELAEDAWGRAAALGALDDPAAWLRAAGEHARHGTVPSRAEIAARSDSFDHIIGHSDPTSAVGDPALPIMVSLGSDRRDEVSLQIDGTPNPEITPTILNVLRERGVAAAFFVIGAGADADQLARIVAEGHAVYNSGYSGTPFTALDDDSILEELDRTEVLLRRYRPTPSPYPVRLPGGAGVREARIHAALHRFDPTSRIMQCSVAARDNQVLNAFLDDPDLEVAAQLCSLEVMTSPRLSGPIVVAHDWLGSEARPHVTFVRRFFENLIGHLTQAGFVFVLPLTPPGDTPAMDSPPVVVTADPAPQNPPAEKRVSMIDLLRIDSANIGSVEHEFLLNGLPLPAYLNTIRLPWINHDFPYAYALVHDRCFVGWLQTIYADRPIGGHIQTVCNLSGWYVLEEFRSSSLRVLFEAIREAGDVPLTALTPSGVAVQIYQAIKFRLLDADRYGLAIQHEAGAIGIGDGDPLFWAIDADSKRVYNHHRGMPVEHCLIPADSRAGCYFIYQTRDRFDLRVADLLYVSGDVDLLLSGRWRPPPGSQLAGCDRLLIDSRFVEGRQPQIELMNPFSPRFYKGPAELRPKLDFLYSEIPINPQSLL